MEGELDSELYEEKYHRDRFFPWSISAQRKLFSDFHELLKWVPRSLKQKVVERE